MSASSDDYFQKVGRSTATTLSAPGYTIGNTTINVGSTANWGDETGVTFAIDEVDSDGVRIGGTYNVFRGVVSSATQVSDMTYVGGDANRDYTAGATTRVYITVSSYRDNRFVDGMLVSHEQDGTLKANTVDTTQLVDEAVTPAKRSGGFKIGVIPGSTFSTTGNKSITGVGFKPKMVVFRTLGANTTTSANIAYGGTDGTTQYFVCSYVTNSPNAGRHTGTDACLAILATASTLALKASYVSFDADGFTINVTTAQSIDVVYEAYA